MKTVTIGSIFVKLKSSVSSMTNIHGVSVVDRSMVNLIGKKS